MFNCAPISCFLINEYNALVLLPKGKPPTPLPLKFCFAASMIAAGYDLNSFSGSITFPRC